MGEIKANINKFLHTRLADDFYLVIADPFHSDDSFIWIINVIHEVMWDLIEYDLFCENVTDDKLLLLRLPNIDVNVVLEVWTDKLQEMFRSIVLGQVLHSSHQLPLDLEHLLIVCILANHLLGIQQHSVMRQPLNHYICILVEEQLLKV